MPDNEFQHNIQDSDGGTFHETTAHHNLVKFIWVTTLVFILVLIAITRKATPDILSPNTIFEAARLTRNASHNTTRNTNATEIRSAINESDVTYPLTRVSYYQHYSEHRYDTCFLFNYSDDSPRPALLNVTKQMCNRATTLQGEEYLFKDVVDRFINNECINVVAFGGSVTCGSYCLGGKDFSWINKLVDLFNVYFPCPANHTFTNLCQRSTGTSQAFRVANDAKSLKVMKAAHLILVEKASNDGFDGQKGNPNQYGHDASQNTD